MNEDFQHSWSASSGAQAEAADYVSSQADPAPAAAASNTGPMKQIVTIRIDVDTLNWFKAAGPGYQTRINQLLREHMEAQRALESKDA